MSVLLIYTPLKQGTLSLSQRCTMRGVFHLYTAGEVAFLLSLSWKEARIQPQPTKLCRASIAYFWNMMEFLIGVSFPFFKIKLILAHNVI